MTPRLDAISFQSGLKYRLPKVHKISLDHFYRSKTVKFMHHTYIIFLSLLIKNYELWCNIFDFGVL